VFFKDKKVLIIGGTGTIGRSLLKHILEDEPAVVRIFSRDEHKQYQLCNELGMRDDLRFLIGDVRDYERVLSAMHDIDYVFHVAAMKHVPACEYNPYEAVLTNIIGTHNVIKASILKNAEKVIFTSTDKAISPTNNYGATKLTAEKLVAAAEYSKGNNRTVFVTVRFGNVIGSRGSVVPLFINQIKESRKITVTDQKMSRFMMTLNQATTLMIRALQQSKGGEIFVLKMPVIALKDLVSIIIEETCKKYNFGKEEITIEDIGLRPGEKMYEELMTYEESTIAWELSDMFIIPSTFVRQHYYPDAKRAKPGTYSSNNQQPLSYQEVWQLIQDINLF
jgi:FlaA1/EpsC-like NDP-sugar epimerase